MAGWITSRFTEYGRRGRWCYHRSGLVRLEFCFGEAVKRGFAFVYFVRGWGLVFCPATLSSIQRCQWLRFAGYMHTQTRDTDSEALIQPVVCP